MSLPRFFADAPVIRMRDGHIIEDRTLDDASRNDLLGGTHRPPPDRTPPPIARPVGT